MPCYLDRQRLSVLKYPRLQLAAQFAKPVNNDDQPFFGGQVIPSQGWGNRPIIFLAEGTDLLPAVAAGNAADGKCV